MASVVTTDFVRTIHADSPPFSLIEQQGLFSRLIQAIEAAVTDIVADPRGFIRDLFSADTKDSKRRQRIYLGLSWAIVIHVVLVAFIAVIGWRTMSSMAPLKQPELIVTGYVSRDKPIEEPTVENATTTKSETPKGGPGGGGGGQLSPLPPSKGSLPPMVPRPQLVSMNPSNIPDPTLPFNPTLVGPVSPPPPPGPIGDPTGKDGEFSGGPGRGEGIGRNDGSGVGGGKGPGGGPGGRGGKGGSNAGTADGSAAEIPVVYGDKIGSIAGYKTWTWIRRQTAIITPEAQENKVIGTVVLRATFNADGTITDVQIAMPVDFMNESAKEALRRSTFRPATINGVPVTVRNVLIRIDVHY